MSKQLTSFVHVDGVAYGPGDKLPADVAKQIVNPKAWEGGDAPEAEVDEDNKSYGDMSADELKKVADERELVVTGTGANGNVVKADLVAALEADDASTDN